MRAKWPLLYLAGAMAVTGPVGYALGATMDETPWATTIATLLGVAAGGVATLFGMERAEREERARIWREVS